MNFIKYRLIRQTHTRDHTPTLLAKEMLTRFAIRVSLICISFNKSLTPKIRF